MTDESAERRRRSAGWLALLAALFLEYAFFVPLAGLASLMLGRGWGPGSSIAYFRSFYVLPALLLFLLVTATVLATREGRTASRDRRLFLGLCVANGLLMLGLLGWYFGVVISASSSPAPST